MIKRHANHGRDHLPGGMDPIPGLTSGGGLSYVMTSNKYTLHGPEFEAYAAPSYSRFTTMGSVTYDTAAPFGAYLASNNNDGNFICVGMPLGPQWTAWRVYVWVRRGPDCGILQYEWATVDLDEYGSADAVGSSMSINSPPIDDAAYWFNNGNNTSDGTGSTQWEVDMYRASDLWESYYRSEILIVGADGTQLSADGTTPSTSGMDWTGTKAGAMDAGGDPSVYWYLRLKVNGKNASSSGYRLRLAGITVSRFNGSWHSIT